MAPLKPGNGVSPKGKQSAPVRPPANGGASKKLGSLSSATLNFTSSSSPASRNASSSTSSSDNIKMPPPPPGVTGKIVVNNGSDMRGDDAVAGNGHAQSVKGKGKADDPIELDGDTDSPDVRYGMWSDVLGPTAEADLAPGKQRIARVKNWLHEALYGHPPGYIPPPGGMSQLSKDRIRKYRRILFLSGPAGVGKTTTLRVLAKDMGVDLVDWGEGVEEHSLGGGFERESPIAKVSSFLARHSFAPLHISATGSSSQIAQARPRLLLMTSLPNLSHLPTRDAFHAALLEFSKNYTSSSTPLVIVHSDAGSGGRAEESWMDRERGGREGAVEVVGREVRDGPYFTEIDFLPLAHTFLIKAMELVFIRSKLDISLRPPKSALQLIALTSNGDLRSAINSLQMLCARGLEPTSKKRKVAHQDGGPKKKGRGSRGGKGAKIDLSDDLRAVLDAVTRREQSLGLFHALGKVLYNKRLGDPNIDDEDEELLSVIRNLPREVALPAHLGDFDRSKSLVQIEAFLPTIPIDSSSFALWIHQSLPSFCSEVEEVSFALDDFCCADIMRTDDDIWQSSPQAIAYALHLTVRGALMALPSPVPRNHQKIIKPQFFASFRTERENLGHLDIAAGYMAKKAVAVSAKLSEQSVGGDDEGSWGGVPSKTVLATELVPMMVKIQHLTSEPLLPVTVKPLSMPPFNTATIQTDELRSTDLNGGETEEDAGGDDGLGIVSSGGWDEEALGDMDIEDEMMEDIEDWD